MELIRSLPDGISGCRVLTTGMQFYLCQILVTLSVAMAVLMTAGGAPSMAQSVLGISEIRLGIFDHNIETGNSEEGVDVNIEVLFGPSQTRYHTPFFDRLLRPSQHLGISVNLEDDTNVAYAGLTWTLFRTDFMFFQGSFGGAVHDGSLKDLVDASYGCRLNFRSSGSLGFNLASNWLLLLSINHMSNANLCDENRGLTNAGVRLGYRFGS